MAQARVDVLREVRSGAEGAAQLCLQWCRYCYEDNTFEHGYRFVWRHAGSGHIKPSRGQARIPSLNQAHELIRHAESEGWGNRDDDTLEEAAERLRLAGCVVEMAGGYVGWPNQQAAGELTQQMLADHELVRAWTR